MRCRPHPAPSEALAVERAGPPCCWSASRRSGTLGRFLPTAPRPSASRATRSRSRRASAAIDDYSGHADGPELARWIAARRPIQRGVFLVHGEEPAIAGLAERIAERIIPAARIFQPFSMTSMSCRRAVPTPLDVSHRRRLAPEAVVTLDWHNDMSKLILDINDRIEAAADDRARGVIIRRLRRALDE